jgi:hypothetical protein
MVRILLRAGMPCERHPLTLPPPPTTSTICRLAEGGGPEVADCVGCRLSADWVLQAVPVGPAEEPENQLPRLDFIARLGNAAKKSVVALTPPLTPPPSAIPYLRTPPPLFFPLVHLRVAADLFGKHPALLL